MSELLQGQELLDAKMKELSRALKQYRIDTGFDSPFKVAREYSFANDTIWKYETQNSLPTERNILFLANVYGLSKQERDYLRDLRNEIFYLRKELK